eukprot:scaffold85846_cov40-Cyclotella_meneghiniana.AAC.1
MVWYGQCYHRGCACASRAYLPYGSPLDTKNQRAHLDHLGTTSSGFKLTLPTMAHNPLLGESLLPNSVFYHIPTTSSGSRISLISKKNIRYDGLLYSINEANATVALENVRSYGTEGRELLDTTGASTFVPPQDVVHAYLLFRGQDIKDLHVHEKIANEKQDELKEDITGPTPSQTDAEDEMGREVKNGGSDDTSNQVKSINSTSDKDQSRAQSKPHQRENIVKQQKRMVGTGESLLNKNMRGGKRDTGPGNDTKKKEEEYTKDDFFDSISCDALDKQQGIDNRLRGAAERNLNLDTFGAVSLGYSRRGRGRGGRGRGRGGGYKGRGGRGFIRRGGYSDSLTRQGNGLVQQQNYRWKEKEAN